jgi:threonylcarbamoyladenosine tRNA methylthiotransferase MtaB
MKIFLDTIGCRLNQSEIETYARQFRAAGHIIVADPTEADLAVVNTCTVTTAAAADSRKKIRGAHRAGIKEIAVTGCWSELDEPGALALPSVNQIISNLDKENLVANILNIPTEIFDLEPVGREPLPGARLRTRAFIKVQDGCDNRCTFCITTVARGAGRSRSIPEVIADVNLAIQGGTQEIVLTGVHMGSWGKDFEKPQYLGLLVDAILAETNIPRLRLSSIEPWNIAPDFFSRWTNPRLARHLHLPLQSGCAATLKRMARKTTPEKFARLVASARTQIPDVAITTDIIVGFPGETPAEFAESLAFAQKLKFARGHVFTYSERPGTAAAKMPGSVHHPERKSRNAQMRAVVAKSAADYQAQFVGRELSVLWETATTLGSAGWTVSGLTDHYLRVTALAPQNLWNQIAPVKIKGVNDKGLVGEIARKS